MPSKVPQYKPPQLGSSTPRQAKQRQYDRTPDRKESNRFYTGRPWRTIQRIKLSWNPLCEKCSTTERPVIATVVHHVIERLERPDLALDINNLESLCASCHSRHHATGGGGSELQG